jgi:FKBP-type peptidyl-prolyl cis-trans isomerase (trigger factor)
MEITETLSDGLKREFQIQVPAADLEARLTERLGELKDKVQLRGSGRARCRWRTSERSTARP